MANTLVLIVIGAITIYVGYSFYARRIDRDVIGASASRATPARMYMDGVDFMPTSRSVLYGYHFKSIAAAGPIVGAIAAAHLWRCLPSILRLLLGVSFIACAIPHSALHSALPPHPNSTPPRPHR